MENTNKGETLQTTQAVGLTETATKKHQELMDSAYDKWQTKWKGLTQEDFYYALPTIERKAVVLGNFNNQVTNGGFVQWNGNDYMELHIAELKRILSCINTEKSLQVLSLVRQFEKLVEDADDEEPEYDSDSDKLDTAYYKIDKAFMVECETYLAKLQEEAN